MPKAYVVAPEGVRVKATIQRMTEVSVPKNTHSVDFVDGVPQIKTAQASVVTEMQWVDHQIVTFASESREFELAADQRIVVEAL